MCVKPRWLNNLSIPNFKLDDDDDDLTCVSLHKYLGCIISDDLSDNADIVRQMKCIYVRGNMIIKKFRFCSEDVKVKVAVME